MADKKAGEESEDVKAQVQQSGAVNIGGIKQAYADINIGGDVVSADKAAATPQAPQSGGVAVDADRIPIRGDFVGGDKIITNITNVQQVWTTSVDHSTAPLKGFGVWISRIENCEGGSPDRIVERAVTTGLSHVVVKIADGPKPYPERKAEEILRAVAAGLRERNIQVWGSHYLRGVNPIDEAAIAAARVSDLQLDGYIADVGKEFNQIKEDAVRLFFEKLHGSLSSIKFGLSSVRYPSYQRTVPWQALLENVEFVLPQIFWEQAHNPGAQLLKSIDEYARLTPARPVFPIGSTYRSGDWKPTASDLAEFIQTARDLNLNGVGLFNWDWLGRSESRELWSVMARMKWTTTSTEPTEPAPSTESLPPPTPEPEPTSPIPEPTFEKRYIQIVRNDEVDRVDDRLGFDNYAETFVNVILDDRTRPPLTIGISGAWGSGKSFILHRVEQKLNEIIDKETPAPPKWYQFWKPRPRPRLHVVRFNAWDYNAAEVVWPGLVRGILDKLEAGTGSTRRTLIRARRNLSREIGSVRKKLIPLSILLVATLIVVAFATQGNLALVAALGVGGAYGIFKLVIDLPITQWINDLFATGRSYGGAIGYMDEIRSDIRALKKELPSNAKIVVIIDDLDRCSAEKIVDTLEAVKLLLNFEIFVVFLAIDSNVIARAIETRYKEVLAEAGRSGYFYLDKIVQIPFRIPDPDTAATNKYLFSLLAAVDRAPTKALPAAKATELTQRLIGHTPATNIDALVATLPDDPLSAEIIFDEALILAAGEKPGAGPAVVTHAASIVWALLARWWPVSALLMHEAMRTAAAKQIAADKSRPALVQLAELADQRAAEDIQAQSLREVADAPRGMFKNAINAAPPLTVDEIQAALVDWKSAYPITIGFTPAEIETFQNLSIYLVRNPRHIKRLVNTYSLIRMLAACTPNGKIVLKAPEATLKWLILSSQWPFTTQTMRQAFDDELEVMRADESLPGDDDALGRLYQKANECIEADENSKKERARLDGDLGVLAKLIGDSLRVLTSEQLNLLRAYSINFNPAEGALAMAAGAPANQKEGQAAGK